eukprot:COSAG01_NODE_2506_length_7552_cov_66.389776_6_plen_58_part_00
MAEPRTTVTGLADQMVEGGEPGERGGGAHGTSCAAHVAARSDWPSPAEFHREEPAVR